MSFPRENLNDHEEIVLDLRPHWWFFAGHTTALVGVIALGIASLVLTDIAVLQIIAAVLILGVLVWFGVRYIVWSSISFVITTDRLIRRSGVFSRQGIEIPLERVNTVHSRQSLFERLIGSGDLVIESAGEQGAQVVNDIRKPLNVQNEIYQQMEDNENRKFQLAGRPAQSIPDQIEKLADLHRQGVLSDAEFNQKKQELLDRL